MGDEEFNDDLQINLLSMQEIAGNRETIDTEAIINDCLQHVVHTFPPTISITLNGDEVGTCSLRVSNDPDIFDGFRADVGNVAWGDASRVINRNCTRQTLMGDTESKFDELIEIINGIRFNGYEPYSISDQPMQLISGLNRYCEEFELTIKFEKVKSKEIEKDD